MKELILKLGFLSNQGKGKEKEIKAVTYSKAKENVKETPDIEKISGIAFNNDIKENTLKGCFFSKEE